MKKLEFKKILFFLLDKVEECYKKECKSIIDGLIKQIDKEGEMKNE